MQGRAQRLHWQGFEAPAGRSARAHFPSVGGPTVRQLGVPRGRPCTDQTLGLEEFCAGGPTWSMAAAETACVGIGRIRALFTLTWSGKARLAGVAAQGRRKGGVLVHCYAGQSRSVAFILAYLCACQGLSLPDAYRVVVAARPCARPNAGEAPEKFPLNPTLYQEGADTRKNGSAIIRQLIVD